MAEYDKESILSILRAKTALHGGRDIVLYNANVERLVQYLIKMRDATKVNPSSLLEVFNSLSTQIAKSRWLVIDKSYEATVFTATPGNLVDAYLKLGEKRDPHDGTDELMEALVELAIRKKIVLQAYRRESEAAILSEFATSLDDTVTEAYFFVSYGKEENQRVRRTLVRTYTPEFVTKLVSAYKLPARDQTSVIRDYILIQKYYARTLDSIDNADSDAGDGARATCAVEWTRFLARNNGYFRALSRLSETDYARAVDAFIESLGLSVYSGKASKSLFSASGRHMSYEARMQKALAESAMEHDSAGAETDKKFARAFAGLTRSTPMVFYTLPRKLVPRPKPYARSRCYLDSLVSVIEIVKDFADGIICRAESGNFGAYMLWLYSAINYTSAAQSGWTMLTGNLTGMLGGGGVGAGCNREFSEFIDHLETTFQIGLMDWLTVLSSDDIVAQQMDAAGEPGLPQASIMTEHLARPKAASVYYVGNHYVAVDEQKQLVYDDTHPEPRALEWLRGFGTRKRLFAYVALDRVSDPASTARD